MEENLQPKQRFFGNRIKLASEMLKAIKAQVRLGLDTAQPHTEAVAGVQPWSQTAASEDHGPGTQWWEVPFGRVSLHRCTRGSASQPAGSTS